MKERKPEKVLLLAIAAVLMLFTLAGCPEDSTDNPTPTPDPKPVVPTECECEVKEHETACTCGADNCDCVIKQPIIPDPECEHNAEDYYFVDDIECDDPDNCKILPENVYYGVLKTIEGNEIKIFKAAGVTDEQTATAIANIQAGHDGLMPAEQSNFETNAPSKIVVLGDGTYTWDKSVLGIKYDTAETTIRIAFTMISTGTLPEIAMEPSTDDNGGDPKPTAGRRWVAGDRLL